MKITDYLPKLTLEEGASSKNMTNQGRDEKLGTKWQNCRSGFFSWLSCINLPVGG